MPLIGGRMIREGEVLPWRMNEPPAWGWKYSPPQDARLPTGELVLPRRLQGAFTDWCRYAEYNYAVNMDSHHHMQIWVAEPIMGRNYTLNWRAHRPDYWTGSQDLLEMFFDGYTPEQGAADHNPLNNDEGNDMSEKNSAALLRNDTKTVKVQFLGDNHKSYTYVTHFPLAVDDTVVVVPVANSNGVDYALAKVVEAHDDLEIEPRNNQLIKWVIQKVDFSNYEAQMAKNKVIEDTVRDGYRANARMAFQSQMMSGLPAEKQAELLKLTN